MEEHVRNLEAFENDTHQMNYSSLVLRSIHSDTIIYWSFLAENELVREFFATFELEVVTCRNNPQHAGIHFRLGGEQRTLSLVELVMMKVERLIMDFWSTIKDGVFVQGFHLKDLGNGSLLPLLHLWEMLGALSVEPQPQVLGKKSLVTMEIVMELAQGDCHWHATRPTQPLEEDDEDEEAAKGSSGFMDGSARRTMGTAGDLDDQAGSAG
ncbi:hypothetical protein Tco_0196119 [Tanacetum coccineum]